MNGPIFGPFVVDNIIWYSTLKKSRGSTPFPFAIWYIAFWMSSISLSSDNSDANSPSAFLAVESISISIVSAISNSSEKFPARVIKLLTRALDSFIAW